MNAADLPEPTDPVQEFPHCPFCGAPAGEGQAFCGACGQPGALRPVGTLLHGSYRVVSVLSTSSTGAVYRAQDERRKRVVVLKELLAPAGSSAVDRAQLAQRFLHELKNLEHLKHPSLPEVYGGFIEDGRHYLVASFVPGRDCRSVLDMLGKRIPERQVRTIAGHLTSLLEYFEERHAPFTHGEIVPSHVVLRADNMPLVIGFGLAPRLGLRPYLELPGQAVAQVPAQPAPKKVPKRSTPTGEITLALPRISGGAAAPPALAERLPTGAPGSAGILPAHVHAPSTGEDLARMGKLVALPVRTARQADSAAGAGDSTLPVAKAPRDDLYGLGATLHALLTGRDVFAGVDDPAEPFPPVRELEPRTSVGMAEVVNQAVAVDPARRFPSAIAMRAAVEHLQAVLPGRRVARAAQRSGPAAARRSGWWSWAVVVVMIALAVAVVTYFELFQSTSNTAREPIPTPFAHPTAVPTRAPLAPAPVLRTAPLLNEYFQTGGDWPAVAGISSLGGNLVLDNTAGVRPLTAFHGGYRTGVDGFVLDATLRLSSGPTGSAYGIAATHGSGTKASSVALLVTGTGEWAVRRTGAGGVKMLVNWRRSTAVRTGRDTPNDLQLRLVPGKGGKAGTLVVSINGQREGALLAAWPAMAAGVGLEVDPGIVVICQDFSVDRLVGPKPVVDEHWLGQHPAWSSTTAAKSVPLLQHGSLLLHPAPGNPWADASNGTYRVMPKAKSLREAVAFTLYSAGGGHSSGGLVFARSVQKPPARGKRPAPSIALAATIDTGGHVSVEELTAGHAKVLVKPIYSHYVRATYGFNLLQAVVSHHAGALLVQISVNGKTLLTYATRIAGLQPATGIAAVGTHAMVVASAFILYVPA